MTDARFLSAMELERLRRRIWVWRASGGGSGGGGQTADGGGGAGPPMAPATTNVYSPAGDSWTEGNEAKQSRLGTGNFTESDRWDYQAAALLGVPNYTSPGTSGVTSGVINVGYGGQTCQTIFTNMSNIITANPTRATDIWGWWGGRNNTGSDANEQVIKDYHANFLGLIPHELKFLMPPFMGGSMVGSTTDWVRCRRVMVSMWRNYRRYTFNHWRYWWSRFPNGAIDPGVDASQNAIDNTDVSNQNLLGSLRVSAAVAQDHPNWRSSPYIAAAITPYVSALMNNAVYVPEQTILDVRYDLPPGGTVEVYFKGYVTGCAIETDDATAPGLFTIAMKPGSTDTALLTRTATGTFNRILNLRIRADGVNRAGVAKTHTNDVRVCPSVIGAASTLPVGATLPRDPHTTATSRRWPAWQMTTSPLATGPGFTFVICFKAGEDGSNLNILLMGNQVINRNAANRLAIVIKDSASATIINWSTLTTNWTVAAGEAWLALSVSAAGPLAAHAWSGRPSSDVDIAAGLAAPVGGTGLISYSAPEMFRTSTSGNSTFVGSIKTIWMDGRYFDFSNAANRRKFWNTDGTPVDLGASGQVDGVTPAVYHRGAPGDFLTGKNFGSGVDWAVHDNWLSGQASADPLPY